MIKSAVYSLSHESKKLKREKQNKNR